ncbi:MAG: hypothetical protein D6785_02280 [Planctomycetota bacterium]|nr:MAG: hypothetical protein D6785_02280 [Planctomycetota bacterium]
MMVSGILSLSTAIAYSRSIYPWNAPKLGVRTPESAKSKGSGFKIGWNPFFYFWLGAHFFSFL